VIRVPAISGPRPRLMISAFLIIWNAPAKPGDYSYSMPTSC
jgi:hypothetical protein